MEYSHRYFANKDCMYYPCHCGIKDFNCLFCYCPLYRLDECPGNPTYQEINGKRIKICTDCVFPHIPENYDKIIEILKSK